MFAFYTAFALFFLLFLFKPFQVWTLNYLKDVCRFWWCFLAVFPNIKLANRLLDLNKLKVISDFRGLSIKTKDVVLVCSLLKKTSLLMKIYLTWLRSKCNGEVMFWNFINVMFSNTTFFSPTLMCHLVMKIQRPRVKLCTSLCFNITKQLIRM